MHYERKAVNSKQQLRHKIGEERRRLRKDQVESASRSIVQHILTMEAFRAAQTVALYRAIRNEVELEALFPLCWESGKRTAVPLFNDERGTYDLAEINADTVFISGKYGISEPVNTDLIPVDQINLMLVPGVAFDPAGNRLGRGGGHYDRLLAHFNGFTAGIAFDFQQVAHVPADTHDIAVHAVISESGIAEVINER